MIRFLLLIIIATNILGHKNSETNSFKRCEDFECQQTKETIASAIKVLVKKRLVVQSDTLNVRVDFEAKGVLDLDTIRIENKIIVLSAVYKSTRKVDIILTTTSKDQDLYEIKFRSFSGGGEHSGGIIFECIDEKYIFKDIHYVSAIN